jgi:hypothetical protein
MNPIIERDILHIGRVMRPTLFLCAPEIMLVEYWRARLNALLDIPCLTEAQRHTILGLLDELSTVARRINTARSKHQTAPVSYARASASCIGKGVRKRASEFRTSQGELSWT